MTTRPLAKDAAIDIVGRIETRGIDFIPDSERHSKPRDLAWVFFGTQITYGSIVLGALPVAFGLNWWHSFTAIVVGTILGSLAVAGMAIIGPRTGTNSTVSSGAFFGIRGRYVGSFITQVIDLGYFALVLWISTPPVLQGLHRLFGWPTTGPILTVALIIMAVITLGFGILGHATIVAYEKFTAVASMICLALLVYFVLIHWDPPEAAPKLMLGSFWATWAIAMTTQIANAISYAPFAGDYARYTPSASKPRALFGWSLLGMIAGCVIALTCGEIIGLGVQDANAVTSLMITNVPLALIVPILVIGLIGNVSNGGMVVYNGTLDLHAILWRMQRAQVGLIFGAVGLTVGYVGLVVFNLTDSILALCAIVTVLVTPWIMINIIGWVQHRGRFHAQDLQAFAHHRQGGRYWYRGGFNAAAVIAWVLGVGIGLLFTNTSLFVGPLANIAQGVDLSFISSALVASVLYLAIGKISRP
ncbi:purine-cytosine permease family protein [Acidisoma cladoniae]|jgi:purine-cytosine permease-like protein|uniref:purine-cytosine permease family protein n=1 Tax=Acidisoma cladoniae TaxID=3040935 RepID=UPI00254C0955|nr:cytosine permease [Acidisoma sp. PAMC 29798]